MEFKRILSEYINFRGTMAPIVMEGIRLLPDGIVVGTGLYSLLTLSYPFAVFFGSLVESMFIMWGLQKATSSVNLTPASVATAARPDQCRSGFSAITKSSFSALTTFSYRTPSSPFPSAPIYILTVAASYIFNTLSFQSKELQALGPAYSSRFYISTIFLMTLLFFFVVFRLYYSCDSVPVVLLTVLVAVIVGALLVIQNSRLFGQNSINLLGIPLLRNRSANGKVLYLCPK
jgi:hypothetical protein